LSSSPSVIDDPIGYKDFNEYTTEGRKLIFNPKTKEVTHLQPFKNKK
jgi:hypothetical protein